MTQLLYLCLSLVLSELQPFNMDTEELTSIKSSGNMGFQHQISALRSLQVSEELFYTHTVISPSS